MSRARIADVLVLMPCSATKIDTAAAVPLHALYNGPLWQTLRLHRGALPWHNVFVLSGGLGFRPATFGAATYEARLSPQAADRLIAGGVYARLDLADGSTPHQILYRSTGPRPPWSRVLCAGAGDYRRVFEAWIRELKLDGAIAPAAPVWHVAGGIGTQRGQLGAWLRELQPAEAAA